MNSSGRGALFPRAFSRNYPVAVRGEGIYLFDDAGNRYLDFSSSAGVSFIGHGNPDVASAIARQLRDLEYVHSSQFVTEAGQELAQEVLSLAGPAFEGGAVFFTSGGSEAVDSALKLARQYQVEIGQPQRCRILSRKQAYHGSTFGAMTVSGNKRRRELYLPMLKPDLQVNTPYCYRCTYRCHHCGEQYAHEVESVLEANNEFAGFILEPVSGATVGAAVPPSDYLARVADSCRRHGVLLIADEVMTGFGRTGRNFAIEHWNVAPDIMVAGKGIASGYAPLGAVIANRRVVDSIRNGSGSLVHGFTYNAHPVSVAAGLAVLDQIRKRNLIKHAGGELAEEMRTALDQLRTCTAVGGVRGIGLLWGVEFIRDKASKAPFPVGANFAAKVAEAAARRGILTYPMQGCVDGTLGDHLLVAPPAVITPEEIRTAVTALAAAIEEVERQHS
jgi:adenosylmethionine-8-amino-7-oxononanoate aminotransferase